MIIQSILVYYVVCVEDMPPHQRQSPLRYTASSSADLTLHPILTDRQLSLAALCVFLTRNQLSIKITQSRRAAGDQIQINMLIISQCVCAYVRVCVCVMCIEMRTQSHHL